MEAKVDQAGIEETATGAEVRMDGRQESTTHAMAPEVSSGVAGASEAAMEGAAACCSSASEST